MSERKMVTWTIYEADAATVKRRVDVPAGEPFMLDPSDVGCFIRISGDLDVVNGTHHLGVPDAEPDA